MHDLLKALRNRRDEAELTRALAAFASNDAVFAHDFAQVLIDATSESDLRTSLLPVPDELECGHEVGLFDVSGDQRGFVDWMFSDGAGFVLLVENKLEHVYRHDQVDDYLAGLEALPGDRKALLAVTRKRPSFGEPPLDTEGWLGSIRWSQVAGPLRNLNLGDETLTLLWRTLLDVLSEDGDFGVVQLKPELLDAWVNFEEAHETLQLLMQDLAEHTLQVVRDKLGARLGRPADEDLAQLLPHSGRMAPVWPHRERVHLRVAIPGGDSDYERLRVQFINFGIGEVTFTVEARHDRGLELSEAAIARMREIGTALERKEFSFNHRKLEYLTHKHAQAEWAHVDGDEVLAILRDRIEQDVTTLVDAGVFDPEFDLP